METKHLGDPTLHFHLTRGVARSMGLNLYDNIHDRSLQPETYSQMVTRCRGCAVVEACESWLGSRVGIAASPPPGCCNAEILMSLKDRQTRENRRG